MPPDLKYALRQLAKKPGFTAVVIVTLALGVGACTAIFSVVNGVLLRPLEYPESGRLVVLKEISPPPAFGPLAEAMPSPPTFLDWEKLTKSYACMAASTDNSVNFTGRGEPLRLSGMEVSSRYFEVYGIEPMLGRSFRLGEDVPGKNHMAVVSQGFWQRALGGSSESIGSNILLNGDAYTVIGIAPPGFGVETKTDVWLPISFVDKVRSFSDVPKSDRTDHSDLTVVARLRPGVSISQAQAEIKVISAELAQKYPDSLTGWSALVRPMLDNLVRDVHRVLYTLLGAVGCVLLIGCVNIANLMLAQASARQREMSIRVALGSGRMRLIRQLLLESLLLSSIGGIAGSLLAYWGLHSLLALVPSTLPRMAAISIDGPVLVFSLVVSVATGFLFGVVPAWLASGADANAALKLGARGATEGRGRGRLRASLVVLEIAISLTLLAATGLLVRSFAKLAHFNPGFIPEHAATARLSLPKKKYGDDVKRIAFVRDVVDRLHKLPGVESASASYMVPFTGFGNPTPFAIVGRPVLGALRDHPYADFNYITPEYFRTMGIRLIRGRIFTETDDERSPKVAIVNETFVRQQFPNQDPVGQRVRSFGAFGQSEADGWFIVGVVADVAHYGVDQPIPSQFYYPYAQQPGGFFNIEVRTLGSSSAMPSLLRQTVYAVDKDQPVNRARTFEDMFSDTIARQHFAMLLLGAFSLVALFISAIGIYGIVAYLVSQRTAEIGIRMALGAQASDVLRLILGYSARLVGLGLLVGLISALLCGRLMEAMLFQTSARDPLALAVVSLLLATAAALACLIPARRAIKVDPVVALRSD